MMSKTESITAIKTKMATMSPRSRAFAYGAIDALAGKAANFDRRKATRGDVHGSAYLGGWCRVHGI